MNSFWRVLSAERLKMSKSYVWLLVIGSPILALLPGALADNQGEKMSWELLLNVMSMMHALLFLPVLSGIFAALICRYEHHDGGWKMLLSLPVTRLSVYLSKYVMIIGLLAAVQLTFLVMVLGMGFSEIFRIRSLGRCCLARYLAALLPVCHSLHCNWLSLKAGAVLAHRWR